MVNFHIIIMQALVESDRLTGDRDGHIMARSTGILRQSRCDIVHCSHIHL